CGARATRWAAWPARRWLRRRRSSITANDATETQRTREDGLGSGCDSRSAEGEVRGGCDRLRGRRAAALGGRDRRRGRRGRGVLQVRARTGVRQTHVPVGGRLSEDRPAALRGRLPPLLVPPLPHVRAEGPPAARGRARAD